MVDGETWIGIDMETGSPVDVVATCKAVEPALVFKSAINYATETAEMILRIDFMQIETDK